MGLLCAAVSTRRKKLSKPRDYLLEGGKWPHGRFRRDAPEELEFYLEIVRRLRKICDDEERKGVTIADIASAAKLSTATVYNILEGNSWGELLTIYRLEKALDKKLWHHEHLQPH